MRARWLKPEFFKDRKIGGLGPIPGLVYEALWCLSDDYGTALCNPEIVKGEMFMFWPSVELPEISEALQKLSDAKRIVRYSIGDDEYAIIVNFDKHQKVHNPSQFRHPPPPQDVTSSESVGEGRTPEDIGTAPSAVGSPHILDSHTPRHPSKNGKGEEAFEELWVLYPKRAGGNSKADALAAYNARIRQGATHEEMLTGVTRYAVFCKATGKIGTEYVQQARTFLGKARHYLEAYDLPKAEGAPDENAVRVWELIKSRGIHHRTTEREITLEVDALVAAGEITSAAAFKTVLKKLDFNVLLQAKQASFAVKYISDRLNGDAGRAL